MPKKSVTVDVPISPRQVFLFCGEGAGVPGLPHQVTLAEARERGVEEILIAAIQRGIYQPAKPAAEAVDEPKGA